MVLSSSAFSSFAYNRYAAVSAVGGKLYIPVPPKQVIYSQFEHISGFAAPGNQTGVTVDKVQILNTLIDQLVSMKQKEMPAQTGTELSGHQIDTLIKDYQSKIRSAVSASETLPYKPAPASGTGVIFDLVA